jgi:hypothetical protein
LSLFNTQQILHEMTVRSDVRNGQENLNYI